MNGMDDGLGDVHDEDDHMSCMISLSDIVDAFNQDNVAMRRSKKETPKQKFCKFFHLFYGTYEIGRILILYDSPAFSLQLSWK